MAQHNCTVSLNKKVKTAVAVTIMVSAAFAVSSTSASAFGDRGYGNSTYRHGGMSRHRPNGGLTNGLNGGAGYRNGVLRSLHPLASSRLAQ